MTKKQLKAHTLWGPTYLYGPCKEVTPPPGYQLTNPSQNLWRESCAYYERRWQYLWRCKDLPKSLIASQTTDGFTEKGKKNNDLDKSDWLQGHLRSRWNKIFPFDIWFVYIYEGLDRGLAESCTRTGQNVVYNLRNSWITDWQGPAKREGVTCVWVGGEGGKNVPVSEVPGLRSSFIAVENSLFHRPRCFNTVSLVTIYPRWKLRIKSHLSSQEPFWIPEKLVEI